MNYPGKMIKARYQTFEKNELVKYTYDRIPINDIFDLGDLEYYEKIALMHICRKYVYDLNKITSNKECIFKLNGSSLARLCNNNNGNNSKKFNNMINKFIEKKYILNELCNFYEIDFNYINLKADEFKKNNIISNNLK